MKDETGADDEQDDPLMSWGSTMDLTDGAAVSDTSEAAAAAGLEAPEEIDKSDRQINARPTSLNAVVKKVTVVRASHTKLQALFARSQYSGRISLTEGNASTSIPVTKTGYMAFLKLFRYWTGDLNLHIMNVSTVPVAVAHGYDTETVITPEKISTMGSVIIMPNQAASITVPWYFDKPMRDTEATDSLGHLITTTFGATTLLVWFSFQTISLFYPKMVPKTATTRTWIEQNKDTTLETSAFESVKKNILAGEFNSPLEDAPVQARQPTALQKLLEDYEIGEIL
nr:1D [potamipivirus A1]